MISDKGRIPHNIVLSNCSYATIPAPPMLARLRRKRRGQIDPPFPLGGPGGETGQSSDLISQEGREKGGEHWIRVLPLLYFILSLSLL